METKRLIVAMVVMLAVLFGWDYIQKKYFPLPGPPVATSTTQTGEAVNTGNPTTQSSLTTAPTTVASLRAIDGKEDSATIGGFEFKDATYSVGLSINSKGAGLDSVTLNQFTNTVKDPSPFKYQTPYPEKPETRPLATRAISINGVSVDLTNINWTIESKTKDQAVFFVDIANETGPVARVRKTYVVKTIESTKDKSNGYVVDVNLSIENLGTAPLTANATVNGPTDPPKDIDRGGDRQIIAGYLKKDAVVVQHIPLENFTDKHLDQDLAVYEESPALWIGTNNVYFNAILRPVTAEAHKQTQIKSFRAKTALLAESHSDNQISLAVQTNDFAIAPGAKVDVPFEAFFGPRMRSMLKNDYFSAVPLGYDSTLVLTAGPCGFCTIPALVDGLVYLLKFFHMILKDWGMAIIALVLLVRTCLHPITKRAQVNMMKMGKLGPEIERLKKKYGDNKEEFSKAQMGLYKQMGFTPVLGCLPLFLQMPIFIALFMSLQTTFELRHSPFFYGFTWIKDLAQPDMLIAFSRPIDIWITKIDAFNLLPLLVAVVQFLSFKYTPRPPATTPEQEQQQKMMQWMTLLFPLMFYKMPAGLNLYYLTSTGLGILEGKITRDHIKKQEELEKLNGPVIIDAGPSKRKPKELHQKDEPVKKTGLAGLWAKLQEAADRAREEAEKRAKK